ncbi:hypothetical protein FGO68_gene11217 [Halteria grandinella]|uniref:Multi-sensor hybrid histidine kinase n=1 Tax=Halteria grandinella TaxID=5974 RepID=A0A8J8P575_HALGN|nr:hypothetical protein FGO68_gene11217 [Halteria grandinella]
MILCQRTLLTIQILISFTIDDQTTLRRLITYIAGTLIHLVWLLIFWRYPLKASQFNAFVTMLSYLTSLINTEDDLSINKEKNIEGYRNLIGVFIQTVMCTVFLNANWVITSIGIVFMLWGTFIYYVVVLDISVYPFIMQFIVFTWMLTYLTYHQESVLKMEFLERKENRIMHQNLKLVLENMPEGVLIFEKGTNQVLLSNEKLTRLIAEGIGGGTYQNNNPSSFMREMQQHSGQHQNNDASPKTNTALAGVGAENFKQAIKQAKSSNAIMNNNGDNQTSRPLKTGVTDHFNTLKRMWRPALVRKQTGVLIKDEDQGAFDSEQQISSPALAFEKINQEGLMPIEELLLNKKIEIFDFQKDINSSHSDRTPMDGGETQDAEQFLEQLHKQDMLSSTFGGAAMGRSNGGERSSKSKKHPNAHLKQKDKYDIFQAATDFPEATFRIQRREKFGEKGLNSGQGPSNDNVFNSTRTIREEIEHCEEIFTLKTVNLRFRDTEAVMIVTQDLTKFVAYQKTKMLAHFYEMLTTTFSHEMQTPLHQQVALIESVLQMIDSPTPFSVETAKKLLKIITNSSRTLSLFVTDMIDLFKIKQGTFDPQQQPISPKEIVNELIHHFQLGCIEKKIELTSFFYQRVPDQLIGDPQRLKQILNNLLQNSLKFTMPHGQIVVHVDYDTQAQMILVKVRDTGIGISKEEQGKLFQLLTAPSQEQRMDPGKRTRGIGLGLFICRKLCQQYNGTIICDSKEGQGTTMDFTMQMTQVYDFRNRPSDTTGPSILHPTVQSQMQAQETSNLSIRFIQQQRRRSELDADTRTQIENLKYLQRISAGAGESQDMLVGEAVNPSHIRIYLQEPRFSSNPDNSLDAKHNQPHQSHDSSGGANGPHSSRSCQANLVNYTEINSNYLMSKNGTINWNPKISDCTPPFASRRFLGVNRSSPGKKVPEGKSFSGYTEVKTVEKQVEPLQFIKPSEGDQQSHRKLEDPGYRNNQLDSQSMASRMGQNLESVSFLKSERPVAHTKRSSLLRSHLQSNKLGENKNPSLLMKLDKKPPATPISERGARVIGAMASGIEQSSVFLFLQDNQQEISGGAVIPQKNKILIVDDNIFNLMVIEQTLVTSFPSLECDKAFNGQEALRAMRTNFQDTTSNRYVLILMDCNMPVMDGFEATKKIREKYGERAPPIVALTAFTTEETKRRCYQSGMIGFLTKPLELQKFREILSNISLQQ